MSALTDRIDPYTMTGHVVTLRMKRRRIPHWAVSGGPFSRVYRRGHWFFRLRPQYGEGWKWALGHRMGGFWLAELGPLRVGKTFDC